MQVAGLAAGAGGFLGPSLVFKFMGGALSAIQQGRAASAQRSLLETRLAQQKAAAADRAATRATKLNKVISSQAVLAGARGVGGAGSSIFRQISQDSFDVFHDDQDRDRLNLSMQEISIKSEMAASQAQEESGIISAFTPFAKQGATNLMQMYGLDEDNYSDSIFGG
jgi:hypothetical protein